MSTRDTNRQALTWLGREQSAIHVRGDLSQLPPCLVHSTEGDAMNASELNAMMAEETETCTACGAKMNALAAFPGGICLNCYAMSAESREPMDVQALFGGSVRTLRGR